MSKVKDAVSAFESGFNCSQAIVRTYGPDYGLSALDSVRVSCGFGGTPWSQTPDGSPQTPLELCNPASSAGCNDYNTFADYPLHR
jgi:hypothetical protein